LRRSPQVVQANRAFVHEQLADGHRHHLQGFGLEPMNEGW